MRRRRCGGQGEAPAGFILAIALWLWFTVLFANFAEAMAEGRGKAQADVAARHAADDVIGQEAATSRATARRWHRRRADELRKGDVVLVEAGDVIPRDGEVIEGVASVDESAITGESRAGHPRDAAATAAPSPAARACCPTGSSCASRVNPGETFLDRMIALVEGAKRQKTPNEIALTILLAALTIIFLVVTVTLLPFSHLQRRGRRARARRSRITVLVALLVCLIPTTIGGLLSAIGIAGMDRMMQANVIATSGRAVEAAGDVDVLLLDKTGTITLGNRQATAFLPAPGVDGARAGRRGAARVAGRRDAGRPQHRRAGQAEVRAARARHARARTRRSSPSRRRRG